MLEVKKEKDSWELSKDGCENVLNVSIKNTFKDMVKYSPSKLCGLLGNAATISVYTKLLSTEQYGIYTLAIAFLSFMCIIFSDWIGLSGLRFFHHHEIKEDMPKYLSTLLLLLAINMGIMFISAFALSPFSKFYDLFKIPEKAFFLVLILIIPVAIRALFFQILRAQIKPNAYTVSTIVNQVMTIAFSVIFIKYFHWGAYSILVSMGISILITDIILIYQTNIIKYLRYTKPKVEILSSLVKYGIPLAITSISLWGINQSDKFIMMHINGIKEVGLVGVGYNVTFSILMTLFVIITLAAVPRIINLYEENFDIKPLISRFTGYFMLISLPIIIIYCLYSKEVIMLLADKKFINAYILVPYLAFSVFFLALSDFTTLQYILSKKTYINTIIRIVSAIVGLALNIILIPKMGLLGLGIATLCGNMLYFLLSVFIVVDDLKWQIPYKQISYILLAFLPASLLYLLMQKVGTIPSLIEAILLLSVYYLTYYVATKNTRVNF